MFHSIYDWETNILSSPSVELNSILSLITLVILKHVIIESFVIAYVFFCVDVALLRHSYLCIAVAHALSQLKHVDCHV